MTRTRLWWAMGPLCLLFSSCSTEKDNSGDDHMPAAVSADDVAVVRSQRILFGHQSVGNNILMGMRELTEDMHIAPLNIVGVRELNPDSDNFICDVSVGKNHAPYTKLDAFEEIVDGPLGQSLDIALMKLCYVDVGQDTDVGALVSAYKNRITELRSRHPDIVFVYMTVPLRARSAGWKRFIKSILGYDNRADREAIKRSEFNTLLLSECAGDPVFDLAKVESTFGDGTRESFEHEGKTVYTLVEQYTDDGGHLNQLGRQLVARAFLKTLADVSRSAGR
jgi:hypothetical protein